jgi:hypothetical protein
MLRNAPAAASAFPANWHLSLCMRQQGYAVIDSDAAAVALMAHFAACASSWLLTLKPGRQHEINAEAAARAARGESQLGAVYEVQGGGLGVDLRAADRRLWGLPVGVDAVAKAVSESHANPPAPRHLPIQLCASLGPTTAAAAACREECATPCS